MTLSGYEKDKYLIEPSVKTTGTGTAIATFNRPTGTYNVVISYVDEKKGQGSLSLYIDKKPIESWKLNEDVDCWRRKTVVNVKIKNGEEIKIVGVADGSEAARRFY